MCASIEQLGDTLSRRLIDGNEEAAAALRELIAAVVIHSRKGEPEIEVTGRLANLVGGDLFPQQTITRTVVAGARFEHSRHPTEAEDRPLAFLFVLSRFKVG